MADTSLKLAHSSAAAFSPDPIALHAQAHNAVSRCLRELRADTVSYETACRHVDEAAEALRALACFQPQQH